MAEMRSITHIFPFYLCLRGKFTLNMKRLQTNKSSFRLFSLLRGCDSLPRPSQWSSTTCGGWVSHQRRLTPAALLGTMSAWKTDRCLTREKKKIVLLELSTSSHTQLIICPRQDALLSSANSEKCFRLLVIAAFLTGPRRRRSAAAAAAADCCLFFCFFF